MKALKVILSFALILTIGTVADAKGKKGQPKNMRIYAAECADVLEPLREQIEERDFFLVDEDVEDDGDIEMELARRAGATKWKSRGRAELNQGSGRCTVVIELEQKNPFGGWQNIDWNEKKFFAPLDAQFTQVE